MTPLIQYLGLFGAGEEAGTAALLNFAVAGFSLILFALSLKAYSRTRLRRMLLVSSAFFFFAVSVLVRNLEIFVFPAIDVDEVLVTAFELAALLLFFLSLVLRD